MTLRLSSGIAEVLEARVFLPHVAEIKNQDLTRILLSTAITPLD